MSTSEYDVTGTIRVSSPADVCAEVQRIFTVLYGDPVRPGIAEAFSTFHRLFDGELPGYLGCDTVYHDMQHSLDVTLAMARLMAGYEQAHSATGRLGAELFALGVVTALFHDAGYIQRSDDDNHVNGAQYTKFHIERGVRVLAEHLRHFELEQYLDAATEILHFTGYERPLETLARDNPQYRMLGKLLGTADVVAQMSDRCYLEKCRDRLYSEFVLGGVAVAEGLDGAAQVQYHSGEDLLSKTPEFYDSITETRLDGEFGGVYRFYKQWFDGANPYLDAIRRNLDYLEEVLRDGDWSRLRRTPPVFTTQEDSLSDTQEMVAAHLLKMIADGPPS